MAISSSADVQVFAQIDEWYGRAPQDMSLEQRMAWVQDNSEIPCPKCGEWLWVMRGQNAGNRGD